MSNTTAPQLTWHRVGSDRVLVADMADSATEFRATITVARSQAQGTVYTATLSTMGGYFLAARDFPLLAQAKSWAQFVFETVEVVA
jgi:hypothetical protein